MVCMLSCMIIGFLMNFASGEGPPPTFCGLPEVDPFSDRIVGGVETLPHELPWMARLTDKRGFFCGGSLIADRYVLTAAHCVARHIEGAPTDPISIRGTVPNYKVVSPATVAVEIGGYKLKDEKKSIATRPVHKIIVHPEYDLFITDNVLIQKNDLALLKFEPVEFNSKILPICLPKQGAEIPDGAIVMVSGWGSMNQETLEASHTTLPKVLMKTALRKMPFNACRRNINLAKFFIPVNGFSNFNIVCLLGDGTDSCRGDSGGPASVFTNRGHVVMGIVSWGIGCNLPDYPGVYTQVSNYVDFIQDQTDDGIYLPSLP